MKYAKIITDREIIENFVKNTGYWLLYGLDSNIHWPEEKVIIEFYGHKIVLFPETSDLYPAIALNLHEEPKIVKEEGYSVLNSFLSSLAWIEDSKINVAGQGGGSSPFRIGKSRTMYVSSNFSLLKLPSPENDVSKLSLALYREALGLNSPVYQFLSFFRIIELNTGKKKSQIAWINSNIKKIELNDINSSLEYEQKNKKGNNIRCKRLDELKENSINQDNIGEYLYEQGRCAIAHASVSKKTINPDNLIDSYQIQLDLPFVKRLAKLIIEEKLDIKTQRRIYSEHLYELKGFKEILGEEIVNKIINGNVIESDLNHVTLPHLNIKLRNKEQCEFLKNLQVSFNNIENGVLILNCFNNQILVILFLDFINNRIHIDPEEYFIFSDNSTNKTKADYYRFFRDFLLNGELEIHDINNNLLSQKDAFVPVNIDVTATCEDFEKLIQRFEQEDN